MILPHVLDYIGYRSLELSNKIRGRQIHPEASWNQYIKDDPLEMKRITYPLDETSLVLDVGGLRGEWSQRIYARYSCNINIFEPHPMLAYQAMENFRYNGNVFVREFGLSDEDGSFSLYGDDIYASLYSKDQSSKHEVVIRKASDVFKEDYTGRTIDLLKLNIEGSEYKVLPDLIQNWNMETIKHIQIQFHNTIPGYAEKRRAIQKDLMKTHTQQWCYDYLYESWSLTELVDYNNYCENKLERNK